MEVAGLYGYFAFRIKFKRHIVSLGLANILFFMQIRRIIKKDEPNCNKLSPLKLVQDIDTNTCLSPWKRPKLCSSELSSTPVGAFVSRKGRPSRPPPPPQAALSENIPPPQVLKLSFDIVKKLS